MNKSDVFVTNIVTINGNDYRIIGRTVVGFFGCYKVVNTVTGKESAIMFNCREWVIVG